MRKIYLLLITFLFACASVFSQALTITEVTPGVTYTINGTTSGDKLVASEANSTTVRIVNTTQNSSNDYRTTSGFTDFLIGGVNPSDVEDAVDKINLITNISLATNPEEEKLRKLTAYNGVISASGELLSINADPTKFDVVSFRYRFVDNSDPETPIETVKTFAGQTGISGTLLGTGVTTYVYLRKSDETIVQMPTIQGGIQISDHIILGNLDDDGVDFAFTATTPQTGYGMELITEAVFRAIGGISIKGFTISGNADLTFQNTEGEGIGFGRGYVATPNTPHLPVSPAESVTGTIKGFINLLHVDGSGDLQVIQMTNKQLDPTQFNNLGTLSSVSATKWSNHRVFHFYGPGTTVVYFGEATYNSLDESKAAIETEPFTEGQQTFEAAFIGTWVLRGNGTVTNSLTVAEFVPRKRTRI